MLFLGVFVKSDEGEIKSFASKYGLSYPVGKDNGTAKALGVEGLPETIFITKDGTIAQRHLDEIDYKELVNNIESIFE